MINAAIQRVVDSVFDRSPENNSMCHLLSTQLGLFYVDCLKLIGSLNSTLLEWLKIRNRSRERGLRESSYLTAAGKLRIRDNSWIALIWYDPIVGL